MGKPARKRFTNGQLPDNSNKQANTSDKKQDEHKASMDAFNDLDILEERLSRLRQLQLSQESGSSNVLKFAFFFIMGVMLTIILYPKIATTLDERATRNVDNFDVTSDHDRGFILNEPSDYEDVPDELSKQAYQKGSGQNNAQSIKSNKSNGNSISVKTDQSEKQTNDLDKFDAAGKADISKEHTKPQVKESLRALDNTIVNIGADDSVEVEIDMMTDKLSAQSKPNPTDDIVNGGENAQDEAALDNDDERGTEIKLTRETVKADDVKSSEPAKTVKKKTKASSQKVKKKTGKTKSKTTDSTTAESGDTKAEVDQNLPPEIKNFKATYQKEVKPKKIFVDGRRIPPMELLPEKPNNSTVKVWLFEDFLSEAECDGLRRVHNKHVEDQSKDAPILCLDSISTLRKHLKHVGKRLSVTPRDFTQGTTCVNATFSRKLKEWFHGNWSYSTAFYPGESPFATAFENRVKQAMGLLPENGGKFQITSYPLNIGYKAHTDCTESSDKRDRMGTVLVYLDTVEEGGETEFTELGIWARPRKGRALMWNNMSPDGECEPLSIHRANKVLKGHKFILQRWYYYQSFYSLGKRPPEPPLPERKPGQPRVSCDEYEHGSCRWYDEWNFEHMIEYERRKYSLV